MNSIEDHPMYIRIATRSITAAILTVTLAACTNAPTEPMSARVEALRVQLTDLDRQLFVIQHSTGAEQQTVMRQYWDMLQKQLQYVRNLPGVEARNCTDWALLDPTVTG